MSYFEKLLLCDAQTYMHTFTVSGNQLGFSGSVIAMRTPAGNEVRMALHSDSLPSLKELLTIGP